jgi:hypothetical protein
LHGGPTEGLEDDPKINIRRVSALLTKEESQHRAAAQLGHVQNSLGSGKTRARSAIFQAALIELTVDGLVYSCFPINGII